MKKEFRKRYKAFRDQMDASETANLSEQICRNLLESSLFLEAHYIYAYYPLGNEVDVRSVVRQAWEQDKRVAFPKVFGKEMSYFEITDFSQLSAGTFGVMEPEETSPVCWEQALVLTPGVAFDRTGGRMGFGKGYYDRYFERYPECIMVGIAYEMQIAQQLPTEEHDICLPYIVTEKKLWETASQRCRR